MTEVLLARIYLLTTLDIMRTYFIRIPQWAKKIYPNAVWHTDPDKLIWTFDDGPHPESTPKLLNLLEEFDITAIFFVTAARGIKYPDLVEQIRKAGHRVGSHGYGHLDGWRTSTEKYQKDVNESLKILDTRLFRPPYGRMTVSQYKKLSDVCDIMMWSFMPGDFDKVSTDDQLSNRFKKIRLGDIVVLHDTPFAVKRITPLLKARTKL